MSKGVNVRNKRGHTKLMLAADGEGKKPRLTEVKSLLKAGADPNLVDPNGLSALYMACYQGAEKVIEALIDGGAQPQKCDIRAFRDALRTMGCTPNSEIVSRLNITSQKKGKLPPSEDAKVVRRKVLTTQDQAIINSLPQKWKQWFTKERIAKVSKDGDAVVFFKPSAISREHKHFAAWVKRPERFIPIAGVSDDWYFILNINNGRVFKWWHEEADQFHHVASNPDSFMHAIKQHPGLDPWEIEKEE